MAYGAPSLRRLCDRADRGADPAGPRRLPRRREGVRVGAGGRRRGARLHGQPRVLCVRQHVRVRDHGVGPRGCHDLSVVRFNRPSTTGHGATVRARLVHYRRRCGDAPPHRLAHGRIRRRMGDRSRTPVPEGRDARAPHPAASPSPPRGHRRRRRRHARYRVDAVRRQPAHRISEPDLLGRLLGHHLHTGQFPREPTPLRLSIWRREPDLGHRLTRGVGDRMVPHPCPVPLRSRVQALRTRRRRSATCRQ